MRKNENWLLHEDNDPKHRSLYTAWKQENDVDVLDWPSQSSDANLIENVWAFIKFKLKERRRFGPSSNYFHKFDLYKGLCLKIML